MTFLVKTVSLGLGKGSESLHGAIVNIFLALVLPSQHWVKHSLELVVGWLLLSDVGHVDMSLYLGRRLYRL